MPDLYVCQTLQTHRIFKRMDRGFPGDNVCSICLPLAANSKPPQTSPSTRWQERYYFRSKFHLICPKDPNSIGLMVSICKHMQVNFISRRLTKKNSGWFLATLLTAEFDKSEYITAIYMLIVQLQS